MVVRRVPAARPRSGSAARGALVTALALSVPGLAVLAGCSRDVAVTPPTPSPGAASVCDSLAAALPATVGGAARRTVVPATTATAAWGDPPVVLRCGVPAPAALSATSLLTTVDGVDWFAEQLTAGVLLTATGRSVLVQVAVPDAYEPAAVLTDLAGAVRDTDPAVTG